MSKIKRAPVSLGGSRRIAKVSAGFEDGTEERLARAMRSGGALVDARGVRRLADPFDLLRGRQALDRENAVRNDLLWEAGARFRRHWHLSRLDGLKAFDFSRESVDGTSGALTMTPTEAALRHRDVHRRAAGAVGMRLLPYLSGLVIEGKTVAALRGLVSETGHERTAEALVIERLREALDRLCAHWGMQAKAGRQPISGWRDEAS
jgi:hypothetical protein